MPNVSSRHTSSGWPTRSNLPLRWSGVVTTQEGTRSLERTAVLPMRPKPKASLSSEYCDWTKPERGSLLRNPHTAVR